MAKSIAHLEVILPLEVLNVENTYKALNNALEEGNEKLEISCLERLCLLRKERKLDDFGVLTSFGLDEEENKYVEITNEKGDVRLSIDLSFMRLLKTIERVADDNDLVISIETAASGKWSNSKWFDTIAITLS